MRVGAEGVEDGDGWDGGWYEVCGDGCGDGFVMTATLTGAGVTVKRAGDPYVRRCR
ncbi:hypothetical protein GCM10010497_43940 [Streptomyces cinereoruber]|uniref:Uncharacterized protein n=1 Tax=Streptomyces cinereoruber TaxID=67260 RepID=A0AAV4KNZ4_9ACTN|nr:hypothetical protein GCM10010497_43940 [Streptomyces cinereoruber]